MQLKASKGAPDRPRRNRRRSVLSPEKKGATGAVKPAGPVHRVLRRVAWTVWPERFPRWAPSARQAGGPSSGFLVVWVVAVALAAAAFVTHLHIRFEIIQSGYSLSRAQAEQRRLRLTQRELRLEFATLKEPGRIEHLARTELGMDRPEHERIIRLGDRRRPRLAARRR